MPLYVIPVVFWTVMLMVMAVIVDVLLNLTSSSAYHALELATTPLAVTPLLPPVDVGVSVGVVVVVGVGVAVDVGVGVDVAVNVGVDVDTGVGVVEPPATSP